MKFSLKIFWFLNFWNVKQISKDMAFVSDISKLGMLSVLDLVLFIHA